MLIDDVMALNSNRVKINDTLRLQVSSNTALDRRLHEAIGTAELIGDNGEAYYVISGVRGVRTSVYELVKVKPVDRPPIPVDPRWDHKFVPANRFSVSIEPPDPPAPPPEPLTPAQRAVHQALAQPQHLMAGLRGLQS